MAAIHEVQNFQELRDAFINGSEERSEKTMIIALSLAAMSWHSNRDLLVSLSEAPEKLELALFGTLPSSGATDEDGEAISREEASRRMKNKLHEVLEMSKDNVPPLIGENARSYAFTTRQSERLADLKQVFKGSSSARRWMVGSRFFRSPIDRSEAATLGSKFPLASVAPRGDIDGERERALFYLAAEALLLRTVLAASLGLDDGVGYDEEGSDVSVDDETGRVTLLPSDSRME